MNTKHHGFLATPSNKNSLRYAVDRGFVWAADNGAYTGFNSDSFVAMLKRYQQFPKPMWITSPDVVGDARETLRMFHYWQYAIRSVGYPIAFVAQDGLEQYAIPWGGFDCLFIGGSTGWKLGRKCAAIIIEAKRRGKLTHMGRVNSARRTHYAHSLGCDTVDGTGYCIFTDKIKRHYPYLVNRQLPLLITP
jgi:hypothetical protein